ncbi:MAG: chemotaxis protein CheW [Sphingobium sp.]
MEQLYLFASVADTPIAVRAQEIEAVVKFADIAPVPGMPPHIAGLSALRSRVLTMIDVAALIHGCRTVADEGRLAIIADISGHSYGLIVEAVHDICTVRDGELPLRGQLSPQWSPFALAMVENAGEPHLLVTLSSFLDPALGLHAA